MNAPGTTDNRSIQMTTAASASMATIATYPDYASAQALVDTMSDAGYPVERTRIVGNELSSVEQVTGRYTKGRAALYGAGTGVWFALLMALLIGVFLPGPVWWSLLLTSVVVGAGFGALYGFIGHWATRGMRDFRSVRALAAASYDVQTTPDLVTSAQSFITRRPSH